MKDAFMRHFANHCHGYPAASSKAAAESISGESWTRMHWGDRWM